MLPAQILHTPAVASDSQAPTGHAALPGCLCGAQGWQSRAVLGHAGHSQPALPLAQLEPALSTAGSSAVRLRALQCREPQHRARCKQDFT